MSKAVKIVCVAVLVTVFCSPSYGYKGGAPVSQCGEMTPNHENMDVVVDSPDYAIVNITTDSGSN